MQAKNIVPKIGLFVAIGAALIPFAVVTAAAGDVTATEFVAPASTSSLAPKGSFADGRGGLYHLYASSTDLSIYRSDSDGIFDTDFGTGGVVSTTVTDADTLRYLVSTAPVSGDFWISAADQFSMNWLISGTGTGSISSSAEVDVSPIATQCASEYPTSAPYRTYLDRVSIRPGGDAWVMFACVAPSFSDSLETRARYVQPYAADGTPDAQVGVIALEAAHGATSACSVATNVAVDPTAADGTSSLTVLRVMHTATNAEGNCVTVGLPESSTAIDAAYVGVDHLSIDDDGTVTRTEVALPAGSGSLRFGGMGNSGYSIVDPGSRLLVAVYDFADSSRVQVARVLPDGSLDTSVGTDGLVDLGTIAPVGDSASQVSITFAGLVTTDDEVLYAMSIVDRFGYSCSGTINIAAGYRMGMLSVADGWLSDWGTAGIGGTVDLTRTDFEIASCPITLYGGAGVDENGQPRLITYEQDGSAKYHVWETVSGVTGGSAGGTGTGGFTNDTGGAPSQGDGLVTTTTVAATTTTVAETTTTVAETTTTTAETTTTAAPADVQLPATGDDNGVLAAVAVLFIGAGAIFAMRRRAF